MPSSALNSLSLPDRVTICHFNIAMVDGVKSQDVALLDDALLINDRLMFGALVDEQTGAVLDPTRRASDRGLSFRRVPRKHGNGYRVEVQGSLHVFHNNGRHNADQFTARDLLLTLEQLVREYGFDLFNSKVNNFEFGVNVELPFSVDQVLNNLISYKGRKFDRLRDRNEGYIYYQATTEHYVVKIYDKGSQYQLPYNLLRVEVKVLTMQFLSRRDIHLNALADLVNVANYGPLGTLLVEVFGKILFDEPSINQGALTDKELKLYLNGCNAGFWEKERRKLKEYKGQKLDAVRRKQYNADRQRLHQYETRFRALLDQHRQERNWPKETAALISRTWERLTTIDDELLKAISDYRTAWLGLVGSAVGEGNTAPKKPNNSIKVEKPNNSTGVDDSPPKGKTSQFYTLDLEYNCEHEDGQEDYPNVSHQTPSHIFTDSLSSASAGELTEVDREIVGSGADEVSKWVVSPQQLVTCSYEEIKNSTRYCLITGLDISRQNPKTWLAGKTTFQLLLNEDPAAFERIVNLWLPQADSYDNICARLQQRIKRIAADRKLNSPVVEPPRPVRYCPITGVDITHQRSDSWLATQKTLADLVSRDPDGFHSLARRFLTDDELIGPVWGWSDWNSWPDGVHYSSHSRLLRDRIVKLATEQGLQNSESTATSDLTP